MTCRLRIAAATACVAATALSGCSSDEPAADPPEVSAEAQPYADAISEAFQDETGVSPEQGDCMGAFIITAYGVDGFESENLPPENISVQELPRSVLFLDEAEALLDDLDTCVDLDQLVVGQIESQGAEAGMTDEDIECLTDVLDGDLARTALLTTFTAEVDDTTASNEFFDQMMDKCPEVVDKLASQATSKFSAVGSAISD